MPEGKDAWHKGYASDYSSSDEDEVDMSHRRAALSAEAKLQKDLDFNNRYDPAVFNETPFTLATINAARNQRSNSDGQSSSRENPAPSSSTAVNTTSYDSGWKVKHGPASASSTSAKPKAKAQAAARPVAGRSIPISNPDPGGRNDAARLAVQQEESKKEGAKKKQEVKGKKKDWTQYSGWKEKGKPVPIVKPKKSLVEEMEDLNTKKAKTGPAKKNIAAAKKKEEARLAGEGATTLSKNGPAQGKKTRGKGKAKVKEKEKDGAKITFTRIPAAATPTSSFPIIKSLNKLREKPLKSSRKPPTSKNFISDLVSESSSDEDPLALFGIASQAEMEFNSRAKDEASNAELANLRDPSISPATMAADTILGPRQAEAAAELEYNSDIGDFDSDEDVIVDPNMRAQREALNTLRENLAKDNARYRQQKALRPPVSPSSSIVRLAGYRANDTPLHQTIELEAFNSHPRRETSGLLHMQPPADTKWGGNRFWRGEPPSIYSAQNVDLSSDMLAPSTITHVSLPESSSKHFASAPPSSSSQLPYSSPLAHRVYGDGQIPRHKFQKPLAIPFPRRLPDYGQENVDYLESMVDGIGDEWNIPVTPRDENPFPLNYSPHPLPTSSRNPRPYIESSNQYGVANNQSHTSWEGSPFQLSEHSGRHVNEIPHKRGRSPANLQTTVHKPIKRTRAYNAPLKNVSDDEPNADSWSTLEPPKRKSNQANHNLTETPKFRLPSNFFALQQSRQSGLKINPASSSSSASARASWFRPSQPGAAPKKKKEGYSTVTSRGVQPARTGKGDSNTKPTFVTEKKNRNEQADFHDQLCASIGIAGQAQSVLRDVQGNHGPSNSNKQGEDDQDDWRNAWKSAARKSAQPSNALSKYAYAGDRGRDFELWYTPHHLEWWCMELPAGREATMHTQ